MSTAHPASNGPLSFVPAFSAIGAGLAVILVLLLFSPLMDGGTTHAATMVIRFLVLALASLFLAESIKRNELRIPRLSVDWPVCGFLLVALGSTLLSPYQNQSLQWLTILCTYALILYLTVWALSSSWDKITLLVGAIKIIGAGEALWVLNQALMGDAVRPAGSFFNPNFLAGYLAAVSCVTAGPLLFVNWRECPRHLRPAVFELVGPGLLLALFLISIMLTGSRGALLSLVAGGGLIVVIRFGRKALIGLMLVVAVVLLVPNPLHDRIVAEHEFNPLSYSRLAMWGQALRMIADYPFGVGLGLYQYRYPQYAVPVEGQIARYEYSAQTPHGEFLQMGVELGFVALVIFGCGLFMFGRGAHALLEGKLKGSERGIVVGTLGGIVSLLAHAAVDSNLHEPALAILLAVLMAIALTVTRILAMQAGDQYEWQAPVRYRMVWAVAAVLLIVSLGAQVLRVGIAYIAYDRSVQLLQQEDRQGAVRLLSLAQRLDGGKSMYHRAMGAALYQQYRQTKDRSVLSGAITELETAMQLNPLDGRVPAMIARAYLASVEYPKRPSEGERDQKPESSDRSALRSSVAAYEAAVKLEPYQFSLWFELARAYGMLEEWDRAESASKRVIEVEPNYLPARAWLAQLYAKRNRHDAAHAEFREIVERMNQLAGKQPTPYERSFLKVDTEELASQLGVKPPNT